MAVSVQIAVTLLVVSLILMLIVVASTWNPTTARSIAPPAFSPPLLVAASSTNNDRRRLSSPPPPTSASASSMRSAASSSAPPQPPPPPPPTTTMARRCGSGVTRPRFSSEMLEKMNNCLFDAVIAATRANHEVPAIASSVELRRESNRVLTEEGLPTFPDGSQAGEQYLWALSRILGKRIIVRHHRGTETIVSHSSVPDTAPVLKITHTGAPECGHWTATPPTTQK